MTTTVATLEGLKVEVGRLREAELALERELQAKRQELAHARDTASDAVLAQALGKRSGGAAVSHVVEIERSVAALAEATLVAIARARERRVEAIRAVWQAEADELRQQAADLRAEAERREARTRQLLDELREHEGCDYVPAYHVLEYARGYADPVPITIPRSESLRNQAAALERRADEVARRLVQDAGMITAASRDELLQRIEALDPFQLGPALHEVEAWVAGEEPAVLARLERLSSEHRERARLEYRLVWRGGRVSQAESRIELRVTP